MSNSDTRAAWHYHNGTKHPHGDLMDRWHRFDPMRQPMLYKIYADLEPMPLPLAPSPRRVSALSAISTSPGVAGEERIPDVGTVARVLYFSAGITKRIHYPKEDMLFRAAACTGALYHIELYVVCGELSGLGAGIYHFDPTQPALRQLRRGDYRRALVEATGGEPSVARAPAIIVYTDVFWRNACKYQAREYRHAFWDVGTILAQTLAMSSAHAMPAKLVMGFADESVNRLLDLEAGREVAIALVSLGHGPSQTVPGSPGFKPLFLRTEPVAEREGDFPAIREMHEASCLTQEEVSSWRGEAPMLTMPSPSGSIYSLEPYMAEEMSQDTIEDIILRRGSTRRFARKAIAFQQLSTVLALTTKGVPADFLEPAGVAMNHLYLIVNAVDGLPPGAYIFHRDLQALELLREGDFRAEARHLGLDQSLPADASVNVFFLADLAKVLSRFGNRGYRAAQLEASVTAGRLYLGAYAQRFGATGLTFYDDDVTKFFSPHAQGKNVMFLLALGRRAARR